jgi:hypothetical protein
MTEKTVCEIAPISSPTFQNDEFHQPAGIHENAQSGGIFPANPGPSRGNH